MCLPRRRPVVSAIASLPAAALDVFNTAERNGVSRAGQVFSRTRKRANWALIKSTNRYFKIRQPLYAPSPTPGKGTLARTARFFLLEADDARFGSPAYAEGRPFLTRAGAAWLADHDAALVGIDALNIDDTADGEPEVLESIRSRFGQTMEAGDIADAVTYIVTRPRHVAVNEMLIRPTEQER